LLLNLFANVYIMKKRIKTVRTDKTCFQKLSIIIATEE